MMVEGKYELAEFLKEGGMGWVYRGQHKVLGHSVAIKLMKPGRSADNNRITRFKREAKAVSLLQHPHIVSITDFGQNPGKQLFIVSEYVRGVTLADILRETGPLPFSRVLRLFAQIMAAVEEAHGNNVIHRDLKPENIMVFTLRGGEDFTKLLDFGIAKMHGGHPSLNVTVAGEVCGTPSYMAPEQIRGKPPTVQTDVYALGVLMFELLTGHAPFRGGTVEETLSMHLYEPRPSLLGSAGQEAIPDAVEEIFHRALSVSPRQRYQSVAELRSSLFSAASGTTAEHRIPCTACNRPPDSPLGFCSEHCNSSYDGMLVNFEDQLTPAFPSIDGGFDPVSIEVEVPDMEMAEELTLGPVRSDSDEVPSFTETPTGDIPGVIDTTSHLISLADTLNSKDHLRRIQHLAADSMVGRRQVITAIDVFMEEGAGVLEIRGTPGMGRTTLLATAGRLARGQGWRVVHAGSDPTFSMSPLYPVRRLVLQALQIETKSPAVDELRVAVSEAGMEADDARALLGLFKPSSAVGAEDTHVHFRELVSTSIRAIQALGERTGGAAVLLDDVNLFDGGSISFLNALCRAADGVNVKVVMVVEAPVVSEEARDQTLSLTPLNADEVSNLARRAAGAEKLFSPEELNQLIERTRGNPLYVDQAIRGAKEAGEAVDVTLEDLVRHRTAELSDQERAVLEAISIFGRTAPLDLILELGVDADAMDQAIASLEDRRLITTSGHDTLLSVQHDLISRVVHAGIPDKQRQEMHLKALTALENAGELLTVRAHHAFEARLGRRALNLLERAGDLAVRCHDAVSAAMHHYPRALRVAQFELNMRMDEIRCMRLSLKLARALRLSGHLLSAEMTLEEASQQAENSPGALALLNLESGRLASIRADYERAQRNFKEAIRLSLAVGKPGILVDAYLDLAESLSISGLAEAAIEELEEGTLMVSGGEGPTGADLPPGFWRLLIDLAERREAAGHHSDALTTSLFALAQAERSGAEMGRARAHHVLGRVYNATGKQRHAEENLSTAITLFRRLGDRQAMAECLLLQAHHRPAAKDSLVAQALSLSRQIQWDEGVDMARRMGASE